MPDVAAVTERPWETEPDKVQWIDEATDLDCLIRRGPMGALCGYVGVPPGHRFHGLGYYDVEETAPVEVHGGLTYAAFCDEGNPDGICHVPEPGRPADVWWLGFDCAHAFDLTPRTIERGYATFDGEVYRDIAYVRAEVTRLAAQLAAVA